jgi:peptide/nickel transport system substrate-binding protein
MLRITPSRKRIGAALLVGAAALAVAVSAGARPSTSTAGGTVTFALGPGVKPDFIFPLVDGAHYSVANIEQFQRLMWRPLYIYGKAGKPVLNQEASLANPPAYTAGNRKVTITLKPYKWSDGKPVTSRDFTFFLNLLRANKKSWAAYLPGDIPDNVKSVTIVSARKFTLNLNGAYSPTWFTGNQLSQIMPIPQHAWDKKSASDPVGNYDTTAAGAVAVYNFLFGEAKKPSTYATNPLWQVVDGPWKLSEYRTDGYAAFVPNKAYSGSPKPTIDKFVQQPFTTASAELNVLRSGGIDYGYLPASEVAQAKALESQGFKFSPWIQWGINYLPFNFANPDKGPIFKQLYVRQALQMVIDQKGYVKNLLKGYGWPTVAPVPLQPANPYVSPLVKKGVYPYSPEKASALLKAHGWTVKPDGVTTCTSPGVGAGKCGAGVASGTGLEFKFEYATGDPVTEQEVQAFQSAAAQIGVKLDLSSGPFNQVIADMAPCQTGQKCVWEMGFWGGGWLYGVNPIPVGDQQFLCGAGANFGKYCDPVNDANIRGVQHNAGTAPMYKFQDYMARQLGVLWMPYAPTQLSMIKTSLKGVVQSPILSLFPEEWSISK